MTHIRERARALQDQHYAENGEGDGSKARELAGRLYDEIDALSGDQRGLLVTESAGLTKGVLQQILGAKDPSQVHALALIGLGLLGVTCYANESNREDAGQTSNGDRLVDEVLETVREMVHEQTGELLSPEQRRLAEEVNEAIQARVAAGEDPEQAITAELHARAADLGKATSQGAEVPSRYSGDGMYL